MDLRRMIPKKKLKPFDIMLVDIELKNNISLWDRFKLLYYWFKAVRLVTFNFTIFGQKWCSCYRLAVPRYVKGGRTDEEQ